MHGPLYAYFADDHRRLDDLLNRATASADSIDDAPYAEFRAGLLRHIGLEEKILFPAAQRLQGGSPVPLTAKLRLDHGAIAALLVPPPSRQIITALRAILTQHDLLEEMPGGVYDTCEALAGAELASILDQVRNAPDVPANPYNRSPNVLDATRRALARAGYSLDDYAVNE